MKAWLVFSPDEWVALVHAETRGKAIISATQIVGSDEYYLDYRAHRKPGLDDKPFTYVNCAYADFYYLDYTGDIAEEDEFINYCNCEICKAKGE